MKQSHNHLKIPDEIIKKWHNKIETLLPLLEIEIGMLIRSDTPLIRIIKNTHSSKNNKKLEKQANQVIKYCTNQSKHNPGSIIKTDLIKQEAALFSARENFKIAFCQSLQLAWPDGAVFGCLYLMSCKESNLSGKDECIILQLKDWLECQLALVFEKNRGQTLLKEEQAHLEQLREKMHLESKQIKNEQKIFQQAFACSSDSIIIIDEMSFKIDLVNPAAVKLFGYTQKEFLRLSILDLSNEKDKTYFTLKQISKSKSKLIPLRYVIKKDGTVFPVEISTGIFLSDGKKKIFGVMRDISSRLQTEKALLLERNRAQLYLDIAKVITVMLNGDERIEVINKNGCQILGYSEDEVVGKNWFDHFIPSDYREDLRNVFRGIIDGTIENYSIYEIPVLTKDEERKIIKWNNVAIKDAQGNVIATISSGQDITKNKKTENTLKENEYILEALFNNFFELTGILDCEGHILRANRTALNFIGHTEEEVKGKLFWETPWWQHSIEEQNKIKHAIERASKGEFVRFEVTHIDWLKRLRKVDFLLKPVKDENDKVILLVPESRDITDQLKMQEKIIKSEIRYRTLYEAAGDAIFIMKDDIFVECNQKTLQMYRCTREQIIGHTAVDFSPPKQPDGTDSKQKAREKYLVSINGIPQIFEWRHQRLDGTLFDVEVSLNLIRINSEIYIQALVRNITHKKKMEEALKKSEEKYRMLIKNIPICVLLMDQKQTVIFISPNVEKLFGYQQSDFYDKGLDFWIDKVESQKKTMIRNFFENALSTNHDLVTEYQVQKKDGQWAWIHNKVSIKYDDKNQKFYYGILYDITRQKKAEQELSSTRALFKTAIDQSSAGIIIAESPHGKIKLVNSAALRIRGNDVKITSADVFLTDMNEAWKVYYPDGTPCRSGSTPLCKAVIDQKTTKNEELIIKREDGSERWVLANASPVYNSENQLIAGIVILSDITERKLAEKKLAETSALLKETIYQSPIPILVFDIPEYKAIFLNHALLDLIQTDENFINQTLDRIQKKETWKIYDMDKKIVTRDEQLVNLLAVNEPISNYHLTVQRKDGSERIVIVNGAPVMDKAGSQIAIILTFTDITDFKEAEKALKESEARYKAILSAFPDVMIKCDVHGKINDYQKNHQEELHFPHEDLLNLKLDDILPPGIARLSLSWIKKTLKTNKMQSFEYQIISQEKKKYYEARFIATEDDFVWIILRDISVRKKTEIELEEALKKLDLSYHELKEKQEQLIQSGKMAALGTLSSGIAHEISQPLMGISMGLELIILDYLENNLSQEEIKDRCQELLSYVYRIKRIIEHIRMFSREHKFEQREQCNINESVHNALLLIGSQFKNYKININLDLDKKIPVIKGNVFIIEQIILNLLSNAKDALLEKEKKLAFDKKIIIKTFLERDQIALSVHDNGIGIKHEFQKRIFEPFYTTKEIDKGTGLGLSVTFGIVKELNGEITVESELNQFTHFKVLFPIRGKI